MLVLRRKQFSWQDVVGKVIHSAATIAKDELDKKYGVQGDEIIFGTLVIDWWIDKNRYIGKFKKYVVDNDLSVEAFDKNSSIGWDLSDKFEPFDTCPDKWKKFTIEGVAKDGEYLDATMIDNAGKKIIGKVIVEVRKD